MDTFRTLFLLLTTIITFVGVVVKHYIEVRNRSRNYRKKIGQNEVMNSSVMVDAWKNIAVRFRNSSMPCPVRNEFVKKVMLHWVNASEKELREFVLDEDKHKKSIADFRHDWISVIQKIYAFVQRETKDFDRTLNIALDNQVFMPRLRSFEGTIRALATDYNMLKPYEMTLVIAQAWANEVADMQTYLIKYIERLNGKFSVMEIKGITSADCEDPNCPCNTNRGEKLNTQFLNKREIQNYMDEGGADV